MNSILNAFLIMSVVLLIGTIVALIFREFRIMIATIFSLLLMGFTLRLFGHISIGTGNISFSTLWPYLLGIILILGSIQLIKNFSTLFKKILGWIGSILIGLFLVYRILTSVALHRRWDQITNNATPINIPTNGSGQNNSGQNNTPPIPLPLGKKCNLPRGGQITDQSYTYAFKNRIDSPSICDVQYRLCHRGILLGSLDQAYCYDKQDKQSKIIEYQVSPKFPNPWIKPGPTPFPNVLFDHNGQRVLTTLHPIIIPDISYQELPGININKQKNYQCITPRGTKVEDTKTIISYALPYELIDFPCLSQIRQCVDGFLIGTFVYPSCQIFEKNIREIPQR